MGLQASLDGLMKSHKKSIDLNLDRVQSVFDSMALNQWDCPIVHVAGTNGKGSTVASLNAIYTSAGYRVGVFTSPHLYDVCERIRVGHSLITEDDFSAALDVVKQASHMVSLTVFESIFLAALVYFAKQSLDLIIIEVGLGGRLDATNVLDCDYGVITSISLDHQDYLGDNLASIAREKAGIIKPAMKEVIHAVEDFRSLFDQVAAKHGVKVSSLGRDFFCQSASIFKWHCGTRWLEWSNDRIESSNIACALKLVVSLEEQLPVPWEMLSQCLHALDVPGRRQLWCKSPCVYLDVAHNQASSQVLKDWAQKQGDRSWIAIIAVQETKDYQAVLAPWVSVIDQWWCVDGVAKTMISAHDLSQSLKQQGCRKVKAFATMEMVTRKSKDVSSSNSAILVFGSFLTVASFVKHWNNE